MNEKTKKTKKQELLNGETAQSIDKITYENQENDENQQSSKSQQSQMLGGKFASVKELLQAYATLEKDYEKTCRKVNELESLLKNQPEDFQHSKELFMEEKDESHLVQPPQQNIETTEKMELNKQNVAEYLLENQQEILKLLVNDELINKLAIDVDFIDKILNCEQVKQLTGSYEYLKKQYPYELIYQVLLSEPESFADSLLKNKNFLEEYVLKDSNIKDLIISQYLRALIKSEVAPITISHSAGNAFALSPPNKPKSLYEAGMLAEKLLKKI